MNLPKFLIGKVLSVDNVELTKYGPRLICYMHILKTNFKDFEYTSTAVRVVIWRDERIHQFEKSFLHSKTLLMITFNQNRIDQDQYGNPIQVVKADSINRVTDFEFQQYYCTNAQGQFDPFSRLIS
ncbi:hypothetical protein [Priestia flexa]|uniref:hypothetical protein n=1 Tax=Priestia flexa TaxID=86664 RepID=UPI0024938BF5|nr:hypothetical protein [Priestia flexa]